MGSLSVWGRSSPPPSRLNPGLVCGINNSPIQKKLLSEPSLMLQRAMELAESLETAAKMHGNCDVQGLHKKRSTLPKFTQWALPNLLQIWPKSSILCYCCRKKGHTAAKCCFKDARCHHCGKVGHSRGKKLLCL